ncbi:hypothetical protein JHK87_017343 [Glycine soja]|nr:hypothetical protein JHK87_017343 [Glycine soja]
MNKMSGLALGGVVAAILMVLQYAEAQRIYVVGDGMGWRVPQDASTYQNWASDKNFTVGDTLSFNFQTGSHNVIEVSEESYNSCSSANPIGTTYNTGPANVSLNRGGQHYYICGVDNHCNDGQRLAITVSASSTALPPSATTAPPPPSSSAPSSFPTNFLPFLFLSTFILIAL